MNGDDDKLLDRYLAGESDVSRRYREEAGGEVPPAAVDDRLRAAARREVNAGPRLAGLRPRAWTRPLAATAVLVLAVGIVLQVVKENERIQFDDVKSVLEKTAPPESGEADSAPQPEPEVLKFEHKHVAPDAQAPARKRDEISAGEPARAPSLGESRGAATPPGQDRAGATGGAYGDAAGPQPLDDPRAWLDYIRRLAERGEIQAARGYLSRYQERFPGRSVPPELFDLLERGGSGVE